jgi:hypothetical protein
MSKRPSPLTTACSRAYRLRLEQMLAESNIRLAAATEALADTFQDWQQAVDMIDNRVTIRRDCLCCNDQERGEFPGVAVPEWVSERWAKSSAATAEAKPRILWSFEDDKAEREMEYNSWLQNDMIGGQR